MLYFKMQLKAQRNIYVTYLKVIFYLHYSRNFIKDSTYRVKYNENFDQII